MKSEVVKNIIDKYHYVARTKSDKATLESIADRLRKENITYAILDEEGMNEEDSTYVLYESSYITFAGETDIKKILFTPWGFIEFVGNTENVWRYSL